MLSLRKGLALALAAAAVVPASAQAHGQAERLVDAAPLGTQFKDRVLSGSARMARAASANYRAYGTADGSSVNVAISDAYGGRLGGAVAQSYVDFLGSLTHGPELARLRVLIAPPSEVLASCGGVDGTLACYDATTAIMVVPGEQIATSSGVTTSYIVAHEYGHHIAANRSNDPFNAFRFGPKYWASYEHVCNRTAHGLLAPGNEGSLYLANPGESWAETYAQLKYPEVGWQFTPLLKPDPGAFAAAQRDVLNPWEHPVAAAFKGSFGRGSSTRRFSFDLTLDGALSARLYGPRRSNYNLVIASDGREQGRTTRPGSRDSLSWPAACRERDSERVTVTVKRVRGSGPFTLRVRYAG